MVKLIIGGTGSGKTKELTDKALRPPEWIPWKDRLEPTDLAVTDSIGIYFFFKL